MKVPRRGGTYARRLVMMVKAPLAGRVKTRLARDVGAVQATSFYRRTTAAVLGRLSSAEWVTILAVSPDAAIANRIWPARIPRVAQGSGDLGRRMHTLMERLPPGPVVIVGSDIPSVEATLVREAFRALGSNDAVFGPAPDGGYWLVGLRRSPKVVRAFDRVRWSGPHALADTLANLAGLRVAFVKELADVDEGRDLASCRGNEGRRIPSRAERALSVPPTVAA